MAEQKPWEAYAAPASAPAAASAPSDKPWLAYAAPASSPATTPAAEPLTPSQRALGGMALMAAGLAKSPADVALSAARGAVAMPISGLAGLAGTVLPGPPGQGAAWQQATQQTIQGEPLTLGGKAAMQGMGMQMEPAIEAARAPGGRLAEAGYPAAGAIVSGLPEATLAAISAPGRVGAATRAPFTLAGEQMAKGARVVGRGVQGVREALTTQQAGAQQAAQQAGMKTAVSSVWNAPSAQPAPTTQPAASGGFGPRTAGAAETPEIAVTRATIEQSPQTIREALRDVPVENVNPTALERHAKAESLPVPVPLTRGMATADSALFSEERNLRGKLPQIAQRLDDYPVIFQENLQAFREQMAPDIFGEPTSQMLGAEFTKRYKTLDETLKTAITSAYDDVKDAMGGREMLVDTTTLEPTVMQVLRNERAARWLPENLRAELADLSSSGSVPFDQIDKLRSVIGRDIRSYNRAGKGNEAFAAGVLLRQLEEMPLVGEVGEVAVLADRARGLARNRFELLRADQAFDAVVNGKIRPDKFVQKFVIGGGEQGVARLLKTLDGTDANQLAKLALLKQLDDKTGTMAFAIGDRSGSRNMTAAGFDKTLRSLSDSGVLSSVFTPEELAQVINLGDVMRYTQQTGGGGYVNYSGTTVAKASDVFQQQAGAAGAQVAEAGLEAAGIPKGALKIGKGVISTLANRKFLKDSLEPLAGLKRK